MTGENLKATLKSTATQWAREFTQLAKAKAPEHIAKHITSSSSVTDDTASISFTVKKVDARTADGAISNYGTLDALAQEYGHPGAVIPKVPGKLLAFQWDVVGVGNRYLPDGRILLKKVTKKPQPAFNGEGYFRPAAKEFRANLKNSTSQFRDAINLDVRNSLNQIGKKLRK